MRIASSSALQGLDRKRCETIVARPGLVVAETIMRMAVGCWSRTRVSSATPSIEAI